MATAKGLFAGITHWGMLYPATESLGGKGSYASMGLLVICYSSSTIVYIQCSPIHSNPLLINSHLFRIAGESNERTLI